MPNLQTHLRNTFLAGAFAIVPVGITAYIVYKTETLTQPITRELFGRPIPVVGFLLVVIAIYLCGLIVTSVMGRWVLRMFDRALLRVPGLNTLYESWKHVSLTPAGTEGTFSKVVLVPSETGRQIGFTSGVGIAGDPDTWVVFVPSAPNPITGRMHFVKRDRITLLDMPAEEAFKAILSTGNYVPPMIGNATKG
jgi:uncharacterized membrane protein